MNESEAVQPRRRIFWSPLYVTALLYPLVMGIPLLLTWLWFSSPLFLGLSFYYLAATLLLAAALYAAVGLWGWWETPRRKIVDRPFISWAERVCGVGKLGRWDAAFLFGLFFVFVTLLVLAPITDTEAVLPVVGLLLVGSLANLLRPEPRLEDKGEARHRLTLEEKRQTRLLQVSQARSAGDQVVPTLRLADPREEHDLANVETAILNFRWSYAPYSSISPETRWYDVDLPVNMERYRQFQRLDHSERGPHCENYSLRSLALPDEEVRSLVWELELLAKEASFCTLNIAGLALSLVQSIPYLDLDPASSADARYPLETLVDRKGSCDCHAILVAALLVRLGLDVLLVYLPEGGPESAARGRMGVAVAGAEEIPGDRWYRFEGRNYYFVETASPAARWGEFPPELALCEHYPLRLR